MENVAQTIISQYAASPTLTQLIANMNTYLDPRANLDAFFAQVWNVDTAIGWGLDRLGRVVGVGRVVQVATGSFLGFEQSSDAEPFGGGIWFSGAGSSSNYSLTDDAYRLLILAKALSNISDGSIPSINQILLNLFPGRGNCYVTDGGDMTMTYTFSFTLSAVELAILAQSNVLPRPCGVSATVVHP